jgi:hypothetical protein
MAEDWFEPPIDDWESGFESDRRVVVSRLGPFLSVFPRPQKYKRRLHHRVYELGIRDWHVPIHDLEIGGLCSIRTDLSIRFQPTVKYAREHPEHLADLHRHVIEGHQALLQDIVEKELHKMEWDARWIERGCSHIEREIERSCNERLAIRNIQCRTRCTVHPSFGDLAEITAESVAPWARHRRVYLELLKRRQSAEQEHKRELSEHERELRQKQLEQESDLLELARREEALRKAKLESELSVLRAELAAEEVRQAEQRESEARTREEQIRHMANLRKLEMEADVDEKNRRAQTMDDMDAHLRREIELLAMERQRLLLEEEIREVKVAKAKGWVINAKRRFPLGGGAKEEPTDGIELVKPADPKE